MYFSQIKNPPMHIHEILAMLDVKGDISNIAVEFKRGHDLSVSFDGKNAFIEYEKNYAYRGLALLLKKLNESFSPFEITEKKVIKDLGCMYDVSRNSVLNIEEIKYRMRIAAIMGYNEFMLYTEDMYEIEKYPYFGHLRGRYTKDEIKEVDNYAHELGISLIPCMQGAAHLEHFFRWSAHWGIRDAGSCLLTGDEKTYEFIEEVVKFVSESFSSRKVFIGMDEANDMGLGQYLLKNGYREKIDIFREHLERVKKIVLKYKMTPVIFDDMFVKNGSKIPWEHDHDTDFPKKETGFIPEGVELVYWDYYSDDTEHYEKILKKHKEAGYLPSFMGGAWTWGGAVCNQSYALKSGEAALKACVKEGINEVWIGTWNDCGGDVEQLSAIKVLQLYAEYAFGYSDGNVDLSRIGIIKGMNEEFFDTIASIEDIKPYPGKTRPERMGLSYGLCWQDILFGMLDIYNEAADIRGHYEGVKKKLVSLRGNVGRNEKLLERYISWLELAEEKSDISVRLKKYYETLPKEEFYEKAKADLELVKQRALKAKETHRELWFDIYNPFGWEVFDLRYGYIISRADTAIWGIKKYCDGELKNIQELEAPRMFYFGNPDGTPAGGYDLSSSGYFREMITAGEI